MFTCFTFPNGTIGQPVLRVTFPNAISQHTFQPRSKLTQNFSFPSRSLAPHQNLTFLSEKLGLAVQPSGTAETKWTKHFPLAVFCVHTHTHKFHSVSLVNEPVVVYGTLFFRHRSIGRSVGLVENLINSNSSCVLFCVVVLVCPLVAKASLQKPKAPHHAGPLGVRANFGAVGEQKQTLCSVFWKIKSNTGHTHT